MLISYEIVPGITSAIAVPAYAGIPVTHRGLTSTFTVITGNEDPTKEDSNIDWDRLGKDPGTLIFLMGVGNLPKIVAQLIAHGKASSTPIALIRWGTRPEQQVVSGTLENIVDEVNRIGLKSPAVIIVGEVVRLRDKLKWFENKPLFGKRVLVTRSREQASSLSEKIEKLGGEAWEYPTIAIEKPSDSKPLADAVKNSANFDWIIFTSVNGVKAFFNNLKEQKIDIRNLANVKFCAIGPKTKEAIEAKGIIVEFIPEVFQAEAIIEGLKDYLKPGQKILLPRADIARPILVESLKALNLDVHEVVAYRTVKNTANGQELLEKLINKEIHIITFTSSSTVKNFMELIQGQPINELLKGITIACIGPITADTARKLGLQVDISAESYTIEGLIESMIDFFNK